MTSILKCTIFNFGYLQKLRMCFQCKLYEFYVYLNTTFRIRKWSFVSLMMDKEHIMTFLLFQKLTLNRGNNSNRQVWIFLKDKSSSWPAHIYIFFSYLHIFFYLYNICFYSKFICDARRKNDLLTDSLEKSLNFFIKINRLACVITRTM